MRAARAFLIPMLVATSAGAQSSMKVHVPSPKPDRALPLVVALHGCLQAADELATMTGFNEAADKVGFIVLYPEQPATANPARCWNWFEPAHQKRAGEPAGIMALVDSVRRLHRIDSTRVYIAGMSAGGAMAVNIATLYPERFAGVMSHSGIAVGAATSAVAAFGVMKSGPGAVGDSVRGRLGTRVPPPLLVVQGGADAIVHPENGRALATQWRAAGGNVQEMFAPDLAHAWAPRATQTVLEFFRLR